MEEFYKSLNEKKFNTEKFCERLKEARKFKMLNQRELAEIIHTTSDSIYSWEKGRSQPSLEMLKELCKALDVSGDYLIGIKDDI